MSLIKDISLSFKIQQFLCKSFDIFDDNNLAVCCLESNQTIDDIVCPVCGGRVHVYDQGDVSLKDMPVFYGIMQFVKLHIHRYRCTKCNHAFTEHSDIAYPGTRVTTRCATWIKGLLSHGMCISSVSSITGVGWDTICRIHKDYMTTQLEARKAELDLTDYRPEYLAVDEFAIHKGHTYATCVMDLATGEVIWVGKGRAKEDFRKFFNETDSEYLKNVKAIAMDMNASYNILVSEYMPHAEIVYDRYHMQAQFGKEVLGAVRLAESDEHKEKAAMLAEEIRNTEDKDRQKELREIFKTEKIMYSDVKKSRWTLLTSSENLSTHSSERLAEILSRHDKLAVCYAMKEEMCRLFMLRDEKEAEEGWIKWFAAAKESDIPQLVHFAELKEKRLAGLIAHARHPISTAKLEGLNNKIKVAKRIGYGYRNDDYFFTLVRYISLPDGVKSPKNP